VTDGPTATSCADDETLAIVNAALHKLWAVADELSRIRTKHPRMRVSIFGSARIRPGQAAYEDAKRLATRLATLGCDIVTGGGPGLMQAANEGAQIGDPDNRVESIGIRVDLPFEQDANAFVEKLYRHGTFFTRLHHFVRTSDAYVVLPGGIGTTLETMMIWQLLQVRQLEGAPLILVGSMWERLVDWMRVHMIETTTPLANPGDASIPVCVGTVDEAAAIIEAALR
jgi:uncharacterized protein (TIGR00730 family)